MDIFNIFNKITRILLRILSEPIIAIARPRKFIIGPMLIRVLLSGFMVTFCINPANEKGRIL